MRLSRCKPSSRIEIVVLGTGPAAGARAGQSLAAAGSGDRPATAGLAVACGDHTTLSARAACRQHASLRGSPQSTHFRTHTTPLRTYGARWPPLGNKNFYPTSFLKLFNLCRNRCFVYFRCNFSFDPTGFSECRYTESEVYNSHIWRKIVNWTKR